MLLRAAAAILFVVWTMQRSALAAEPTNEPPLPAPKPVPLMQAVPQADDQASFQRDGRELTRYHFSPTLNRPFLFPIIGPAGRSLTRIGHPHDPISHSHHYSVWITHHDVGGVDFWGDRGKGRIIHQRIENYADGPEAASLVAFNAWTKNTGEVLLNERRQVTVAPLDDDEWFLMLDLEFTANQSPLTLGKTSFGLVGVRMAKTIGVHDGGGQIRNSAGGINEKGVFWKPAKWVDYSGPITSTATEGITLMDHPANPNHPTVFHVRDDGWMGTSLTFDGPRTLEPGQPLRLRYGLYVHRGMPAAEVIDSQWIEFSRTEPPKTLAPQKK
jgi:hypothetical protein